MERRIEIATLEEVLNLRWQDDRLSSIMCGLGAVIPVTGLNIGFKGQVSRTGERVIATGQVNTAAPNSVNFGDVITIIPDTTGGTIERFADYVAAQITAGTGTLGPLTFCGVAVREVKTNLGSYPYSTGGTPPTGNYAAGQMAEFLERGSVTVYLSGPVGTPKRNNPCFIRVALNSSVTAGVVGGIEAQADASVTPTGSGSASSATVTVSSGTGIVAGQIVTAPFVAGAIPANTFVASVSGTTVTLSQNLAAALSSASLIFASTIQLNDVVFRTGVVDGNNMCEITLRNREAA